MPRFLEPIRPIQQVKQSLVCENWGARVFVLVLSLSANSMMMKKPGMVSIATCRLITTGVQIRISFAVILSLPFSSV